MRAKTPGEKLREALIDVMGNSSRELSEREALEIGCEVADEWRDRLNEIEDEE